MRCQTLSKCLLPSCVQLQKDTWKDASPGFVTQGFQLLGEWLAWSACYVFTPDLSWWIIRELIQISANGSGPLFSHHLLVVSIACHIFRYHLLLHVCGGEKGCGWKAVPWSHSARTVTRRIGSEPAPAASELARQSCVVARSLHGTLGEWVAISIRRLIEQRNHLPKEILGSPPLEVFFKNTLNSYFQEPLKRSSACLGAADSLEDHWPSTLFPEICLRFCLQQN